MVLVECRLPCVAFVLGHVDGHAVHVKNLRGRLTQTEPRLLSGCGIRLRHDAHVTGTFGPACRAQILLVRAGGSYLGVGLASSQDKSYVIPHGIWNAETVKALLHFVVLLSQWPRACRRSLRKKATLNDRSVVFVLAHPAQLAAACVRFAAERAK